jgi:hypothetical protein
MLALQQDRKFSPTSWWRRCDLNLAPIRYDRVLRKDGGPIERLEKATLNVREGALFAVNAYLDAGLRPQRGKAQIYGDADGGSTHRNELVARFKAISEAIERWAFWDRSGSNSADLYGFDIDNSTTGMAAFPGLFLTKARHAARIEAIERFALQHWWEGRLAHEEIPGPFGSRAVYIKLPFDDVAAVVVYEDDPVLGTAHYGYGAGATLPLAMEQAHAEMVRQRLVINRYVERNPSPTMGLAAIQGTHERRSIFFALPQGRALFQERLESTPWSPISKPKRVYDGWIPGPWDRYATVWRCLYEPPSDDHASSRMDYFFW